jgi:hypothetical protein
MIDITYFAYSSVSATMQANTYLLGIYRRHLSLGLINVNALTSVIYIDSTCIR